jgi:hypothetical protein
VGIRRSATRATSSTSPPAGSPSRRTRRPASSGGCRRCASFCRRRPAPAVRGRSSTGRGIRTGASCSTWRGTSWTSG